MNEALLMIAGILAGFLATWLYYRSVRVVLSERVLARDEQIRQFNEEMQAQRIQMGLLSTENAALGAKVAGMTATIEQAHKAGTETLAAAEKAAGDRLVACEKAHEEKIAGLADAAAAKLASAENSGEERLASAEKMMKEKLEFLDEAQRKFSDAFSALSAEALKSNNQAFLQLAGETFKKHKGEAESEMESRQKAIEQVVKPLAESLGRVDHQIQEMEKTRAGAYAGLAEQVRAMSEMQAKLQTETGNLVTALRTPQGRGRWGEIQLQRVVELAGMVDRCDFQQQPSVETEDGRLRPDLIVRLPLGKSIVVDAKVPLKAYLEAVEATDDATRAAKLKEHAIQLRSHMDRLAAKNYWDQFQPTPEFVVLFLPGESVFSAALQQIPDLIETGPQQGVMLATPTTLIALLKAVAFGWRQESLAENAQRIADLGRDLYSRLCTLGGHFVDLRKNLDKAVISYNSAVGSLESRVMVTARRFKELEVGAPMEIELLNGIETATRHLQATDLIGVDTMPLFPTQDNETCQPLEAIVGG